MVRLTLERTNSLLCYPPVPGAHWARLSLETGCRGLVLQRAAIVLKHDSAFNGYCSHSSHLAPVGEERLGKTDFTFSGAPVLRDIYAACKPPEKRTSTLPITFTHSLYLLTYSFWLTVCYTHTHTHTTKAHTSLISPHLPLRPS